MRNEGTQQLLEELRKADAVLVEVTAGIGTAEADRLRVLPHIDADQGHMQPQHSQLARKSCRQMALAAAIDAARSDQRGPLGRDRTDALANLVRDCDKRPATALRIR